MKKVIRLAQTASDRLLARLVPEAGAAKAQFCLYEYACEPDNDGPYLYRRWCCYHPGLPKICGNWETQCFQCCTP